MSDAPAPVDPGPDTQLGSSAAALVAGGGALLALSAFLPWVASGSGSSLPLREVGDVLLRGQWSAVPSWVGTLAYAIPVAGGVTIVTAGLRALTARRAVTVVAAVVTTLLVATSIVFVVRLRLPGPGFAVAWLGDLLVIAGGIRARRDINRHDRSLQWGHDTAAGPPRV